MTKLSKKLLRGFIHKKILVVLFGLILCAIPSTIFSQNQDVRKGDNVTLFHPFQVFAGQVKVYSDSDRTSTVLGGQSHGAKGIAKDDPLLLGNTTWYHIDWSTGPDGWTPISPFTGESGYRMEKTIPTVPPPTTPNCSSTRYTVTVTAGANGKVSAGIAIPAGNNANLSSSLSISIAGNCGGMVTIIPDPGYKIVAPVGGTCSGNLFGIIFLLNPVIADCTIHATFQLAKSQLVVSTQEATNITQTSAVLHGTGGDEMPSPTLPLTGYFRYSTRPIPPVYCNDIYGTNMLSTPDVKLGLTNGTQFYQNVTGLTPNTTYYYCAIISNSDHIAYGGEAAVKQFHTNCNTTTIETKQASYIRSTGATLSGTYCSTKDVKTSFRYREFWSGQGEPPQWIKVGEVNHPVGDHSNVYGNISYILSRLKPETKYEFRAVAENTGEVFEGFISDFTTTAGIGINDGGSDDDDTTGGDNPGTNPGGINPGTNPGGGNNPDGGTGPGPGGGWTPSGGGGGGGNNGGGNNGGGIINSTPLTLGQTINPPSLAIVRYHEGIETVFTRQIVADVEFARRYGYRGDSDLESFAWYLSDQLARMFGYVDANGREIRVSFPDIAAYQLQLTGNQLTVYEYYAGRIVDVRKANASFKSRSEYEYYYNKR